MVPQCLLMCVSKRSGRAVIRTGGVNTKPGGGLYVLRREAVLARSAPRLIYVSCNPRTFERDATALLSGGYRLERVRTRVVLCT